MSLDSSDLGAIGLTLRLAGATTLLLLLIAAPLAWWLAQTRSRWRAPVSAVVALPLVLPPTVLGYYLLVLVGRGSPVGHAYEKLFGQPLVFTWEAAVAAAFLHSAPLFIKAARATLESVDYRYEWAAQSLGASEWRTFWHVTLPLAKRGLSALATLAFARSLGDFGATIMVAGNIPDSTQTLSVAIYDAVESGNGQLARVLVVVTSVTALALLWPAGYLGRGSRRSSVG